MLMLDNCWEVLPPHMSRLSLSAGVNHLLVPNVARTDAFGAISLMQITFKEVYRFLGTVDCTMHQGECDIVSTKWKMQKRKKQLMFQLFDEKPLKFSKCRSSSI